jgi:hypothetical protein
LIKIWDKEETLSPFDCPYMFGFDFEHCERSWIFQNKSIDEQDLLAVHLLGSFCLHFFNLHVELFLMESFLYHLRFRLLDLELLVEIPAVVLIWSRTDTQSFLFSFSSFWYHQILLDWSFILVWSGFCQQFLVWDALSSSIKCTVRCSCGYGCSSVE